MLGQTWASLLFAHWELPAGALSPLVPRGAELDLFDGAAWIGVTPFRLECFRPRGMPAVPRASTFPEVNVRTYVTVRGEPGLLFLSLDTPRTLAVVGARTAYRLPYFRSRAAFARSGHEVRFASRRVGVRPRAAIDLAYGPVGPHSPPAPRSLDAWLVERYRAYTATRRGVLCADIHHPPWRLAPAEAEIRENTMAAPLGVSLRGEPLLHHALDQHVLTWRPRRAA